MEYMANTITWATGGSLFRIDTVQSYLGTHTPLVNQASRELGGRVKSELVFRYLMRFGC